MADEHEIIPFEGDQLISLARVAEERVAAIRRIKIAAMRVTNASDWVDENGKPYLQASGAEKVARVFGISWRIGEPIRENSPDGHFSYTYKGEFSLHAATIEAIGTRSSRDPFFSVRYRDGVQVHLPASEIDEGNVKMASYTNCIANGVTRILGIRNLTWDDLAEVGIYPMTRVSYKQPPRGGDAVSSPSGEPVERLASDAQMRFIYKLYDDLGIPAEERRLKAAEILSKPDIDLNRLGLEDAKRLIDALKRMGKGGQQ